MNEPKFDEIAKLYYQSIYNYCRVRLGDDYAAQDCTQETFLILYRKTDKLDFTDNIRAWLYRTADNIMKNYRKTVSESVSFDSETVMNITAEDTYCEDEPFEKLLTAEEVLSVFHKTQSINLLYYTNLPLVIYMLQKIFDKEEITKYNKDVILDYNIINNL